MDVIKIQDIAKWAMLQPGHGLSFEVSDARKIRVEFNTETDTRIDAVIEGKVQFLGVVKGHQAIEFVVTENVELAATSDGEVWYFTNEGGDLPFEVPDAQSFVKIMQRRARNAQLELMMFKMNQNIENRLAAQAAEYEAMVARLGYDPDTGEANDGQTAVTDTGGDEPEEPAEPASAGATGDAGAGTSVSAGSTTATK